MRRLVKTYCSTQRRVGAVASSCGVRLATTSSNKGVSETALGSELSKSGFQHPTENFNMDFSKVPDTDVGDVDTKPATNVSMTDMVGPWLALADGLQGELFVKEDGFVYFRPAGLLGHGIGTVQLQESPIGMTMFRIDLEVYAYTNDAKHPPNAPRRFQMTGMVCDAHAPKANYSTRTLAGSTIENGISQQFNAAKLFPWDPKSEVPFTPNEEVLNGFKIIFGNLPLSPTSHITRAKERKEELAAKKPSAALLASGGASAPFHMDLAKYKVGGIDSVYYIPNYVSEFEEHQFLEHLKQTPEQLKTKLTKRTCQEWGCTMCPTCNQSFVSDYNLPPWSKMICDMLLHDGIFSPSIFPNNVRIHEYETCEGIAPHCDGPIYVPRVAILSLASTSVMSFYPRREPYEAVMEHYNDTFKFDGEIAKQTPVMSVVMEPRSMLIFANEAYSHHPHGVSDRAIDDLSEELSGPVANRHFLSNPDVKSVKRQYRVGVTIRNLLPRCTHIPQRAEFLMREAWLSHNQRDLNEADPLKVLSQPKSSRMSLGRGNVDAKSKKESQPSFQSMRQPPIQQPNTSVTTSPTSAAGAVSSTDVMALRKSIDDVLIQQKEIIKTLDEIKGVLGYTTTSNITFQKETSTILNYLSTSIIDIQSTVTDIQESVDTANSSSGANDRK